jgi:hypothetical protein
MHKPLQHPVHLGQTQVSAHLEQEQTHPHEHSKQGLKGSKLQELHPEQSTQQHLQQVMCLSCMQQHLLGRWEQDRQPLVQQIQHQLQHSIALKKHEYHVSYIFHVNIIEFCTSPNI